MYDKELIESGQMLIESYSRMARVYADFPPGSENEDITDFTRERILSDGTVVIIHKRKNSGDYYVNFNKPGNRTRLVGIGLDTFGLTQLQLLGMATYLGGFPVEIKNLSRDLTTESSRRDKFRFAMGTVVEWVSKVLEEDRFTPPPLETKILGE